MKEENINLDEYEEVENPLITVLFDAIIGGKGKVYRKKKVEEEEET